MCGIRQKQASGDLGGRRAFEHLGLSWGVEPVSGRMHVGTGAGQVGRRSYSMKR